VFISGSAPLAPAGEFGGRGQERSIDFRTAREEPRQMRRQAHAVTVLESLTPALSRVGARELKCCVAAELHTTGLSSFATESRNLLLQ
jgi:hypothetical protein